jgi:hypothetical protein
MWGRFGPLYFGIDLPLISTFIPDNMAWSALQRQHIAKNGLTFSEMNPPAASYAGRQPVGEAQSRQSHPLSFSINVFRWSIAVRVIHLAGTLWTLPQLKVDNFGELSGVLSAVEFAGH